MKEKEEIDEFAEEIAEDLDEKVYAFDEEDGIAETKKYLNKNSLFKKYV